MSNARAPHVPGALARLLVAVAVPAVAAIAGAREFRSADIHPDGYPTVMAVKRMGEEIARRTGGRHSIRVFTGNEVGGEREMIERIRIGALDLVRVNVAPMNDLCPATIVPTLPFLFRSRAHLRAVLDGPIGEELLRACEAQGLVGLAFYDSGARSLYTVRSPVHLPSDLSGMRIRVQQSRLWVSTLQSLGAEAMPMPYGEVYTALRAGLVDGAENNWPSYETSRHHEVAPYYALTEHSMAPEMLLIRRGVWDALSPADRQVFREAARASVPYMRKLWDAKERASREAVVAAGAKVIDVDKQSFRSAMKPVYDRYVRDPKLRRLVARIQSTSSSR